MKKSIMYSTMGILGVVAVAGVSVSAVYYVKYKDLDDGLDFEGKKIQINMYDSPTATNPVSKTYEVKDGENTLQELMLDHTSDFEFGPVTQFGRMVLAIYNTRAVYTEDKSWWQLASPTYILAHPDKKGVAGQGQVTIPNGLNIGASGVILNMNHIINFYKTPSA